MQEEHIKKSYTPLDIVKGTGVVALAAGADVALDAIIKGGGGGAIVIGTLLAAGIYCGKDAIQLAFGHSRDAVDRIIPDIEEDPNVDQSTIAKAKRLLGMKETVPGKPKDEKDVVLPRSKSDKEPFEYDASATGIPKKFVLDTVLDKIIFYNSKGKIYFGTLSNGEDLALPMYTVYHVLYIAKSNKGKSNDYHFLMMQAVEFAETYFINPFANNVKRLVDPNDRREIQVWKPIFDRLQNRHAVTEANEIIQVLQHLLSIIKKRKINEESQDEWDPVFLFIDELPECRILCKEAGYKGKEKDLFTECLDRLVRTGRQFGVFVFLASQTAAVTDIGLSEASQGQFSTLLYGGGDKRGAVKMFGEITPETETMLKTKVGLKLALAGNLSNPEFLQTPLSTNEALFEYYGQEAFDLEYWKHWKSPSSRISNSNSISHFQDDEENDPEIQNDAFEEEIEIEKETWDDDKIVVRIGDQELTEGQVYMRIWDAITFLQQKKIEMEAKNVSGKRLPEIVTINAIVEKAGLGNGQREYVIRIAEELNVELDKSNKGRKAVAK